MARNLAIDSYRASAARKAAVAALRGHAKTCARCDFYALEAKTNLQRMLASIPLTDEERAAMDGR